MDETWGMERGGVRVSLGFWAWMGDGGRYSLKWEKKCLGAEGRKVSSVLEIPMEMSSVQIEKSGIWERDLKMSFDLMTQNILVTWTNADNVKWGWRPDWRLQRDEWHVDKFIQTGIEWLRRGEGSSQGWRKDCLFFEIRIFLCFFFN